MIYKKFLFISLLAPFAATQAFDRHSSLFSREAFGLKDNNPTPEINDQCVSSVDCGPGFFCQLKTSGNTCQNVNECLNVPRVCDTNAICSDTVGSFICTCKSGYAGNGRVCNDINECIPLNGGNANCLGLGKLCHNLLGTFECCDVGTVNCVPPQ